VGSDINFPVRVQHGTKTREVRHSAERGDFDSNRPPRNSYDSQSHPAADNSRPRSHEELMEK
jgi:hypothetical protein